MNETIMKMISSNEPTYSIIFENHKLTKINEAVKINYGYIANFQNNVFIDSVPSEKAHHVILDRLVTQKIQNDEYKIKLYNEHLHKCKYNVYDDDKTCKVYHNKITTCTNLTSTLFYCNHSVNSFAHVIVYKYTQIYFYHMLKKYINDLHLIICNIDDMTMFLLKLLNITDYTTLQPTY